MSLSRDAVPAPQMPVEEVEVASLGGSVVVRGRMLSDDFALNQSAKTDATRHAPETLARCVLADDGAPLWTIEEWDIWGHKHLDDMMMLYAVVRRLSGDDAEDLEKK